MQRAKVQTRAMVNKEMEKKHQLRVGITPANNTATANVNSENGKKTSITLNEAKKKGRERSSQNSSAKSSDDDTIVKDIYQNVSDDFHLKFDFFFSWWFSSGISIIIDCIFFGIVSFGFRRWVRCTVNVAKLV